MQLEARDFRSNKTDKPEFDGMYLCLLGSINSSSTHYGVIERFSGCWVVEDDNTAIFGWLDLPSEYDCFNHILHIDSLITNEVQSDNPSNSTGTPATYQ